MAMTNLNLGLNGFGGQTGTGTLGGRDANGVEQLTGLEALAREPSLTFAGANTRGLANTPMLDSEAEPPPIDVFGKKPKEFDFSPYVDSAGKFPGEIVMTGASVFVLRRITVPSVTTQVDDPKNQKAVDAAAEKLKAKLVEIGEKIANLNDTATVVFKDGKTMTGAEVKKAWAEAKFVMTDRNLGAGTTENSVALARADGLSKTVTVNFQQYNSTEKIAGAISYMIAHELGHTTQKGFMYFLDMKNQYQQNLPPNSKSEFGKSPEAFKNEQFVHKFAQSLLAAFNEGDKVPQVYIDKYGK